MKRALTSATVMTAILITATLVWAGGMGGGMGDGRGGGGGGGMGSGMAGQGHMMDSYGGWQSGPRQRNGYYDQDHAQSRYNERQRAQEAYDRDMRLLDREMNRKQQALNSELQKKDPDKHKIEALRNELSELEQRYDARRAEFEHAWGQEDRQ